MRSPVSQPGHSGLGAAGLGSSMWSSPLAQRSQVENIAPSYIQPHLRLPEPTSQNDIQSEVRFQVSKLSGAPPHLRHSEINSQNNIRPEIQNPGSKLSGYIPPHLRGFNIPLKANATQSRPLSPRLQSKPVTVKNSQASDVLVKNSPVTNQTMQKQEQQLSTHASQAATSPANLQLKLTTLPLQIVPGANPESDADKFLSFLKQKAANDAQTKKKAIVEKARSPPVEPRPVQPSTINAHAPQLTSEVQPFMLLPPRSKFVPNAITDSAFQAFLSNQIKAPAANGKKYTFIGGQDSSQTVQAASKPCRNWSAALQVAGSNQKASASPFGKVDPHSAFSPRDATAKTNAPLSSNDAKKLQTLIPNNANDWQFPVAGLTPSADELVEPGYEPRNSSGGYEDKISNAGIVEEKTKENVRASQGEDAKQQLLDWDGKTWLPPPVDWEGDRKAFDNSFMDKYILEDWEPEVPRGLSTAVDTSNEKFGLGVPIENLSFASPIEHDLTLPDVSDPKFEEKRLHQNANAVSNTYMKKLEKKNKAVKDWAKAHVANNLRVAQNTKENEDAHPYKPAIDIYLRPATEVDAKGILDIYDYYVLNSMTTEDQVPISEGDIDFLLKHTKSEKLPIIVAVKGKMPIPSQTTPFNHGQQKGKASLPQFESIIGFGYAETHNYGIGGTRLGRSRFTANLHFYVHPEYTRKGVGRSLLDRLIQSMSHGYGAKDGYEWMNTTEDPVYINGGVLKWHQLVIQYPVQSKDDPNYEWMKKFLRRYYFDEEGRIHNIARSSPTTDFGAKFHDIIFFSKEASTAEEFAAFL